jgi:hypothetical protein
MATQYLNLRMINKSFMLILLAFLTACGGGGGSDDGDEEDDEPSAPTAFFVDSGVHGLKYESASYSGTTNAQGAFEFAPGETVTFSYQGLTLGSITTSSDSRTYTPLDIFSTTNTNDQRVKNMLVLLQSLDLDKDPSNGIYLSVFFDDTSDSDFDLSSLDFTSSQTDFADNLQTIFDETQTGYFEYQVVDEAAATEHFEATLAGINAEFDLVGTWIERNDNGEIRYKHTYSQDGNMQAVEYRNCKVENIPDSPTLGWVERNCDEANGSYTYEYENKAISIFKDGTQVDTCYVLRSNKIAYESTCSTDSLIFLTRVIESLNDDIIEDNYRLVTPDSSSYADLLFDVSDHTGSFKHYSNGAVDEQGTFTSWSAVDQELSYDYEITGGASGTETLTLRANNDGIQGALATDSEEENDTQLLIPNFNANAAAIITNSSATYGVYDGVTGRCTGLLKFEGPSYSVDGSYRYQRSSRNAETCTYDDISQDQGNTFAVLSGGVIHMNVGDGEEYCWPVSLNVTGEGGIYVLAACSEDGDTTFSYEYWYGL